MCPTPLAKLEILDPYNNCYRAAHEHTALQHIEPFLPLPNLQSVYTVSAVAHQDADPRSGEEAFYWQPQNTEIGMALRRLEMAYCCCDARGIRSILSHTPHLEIFKYFHGGKNPDIGTEWEPEPFFAAIAECVGGTLKELSVLVMGQCAVYGDYVTDFTEFRVLEELELDLDSLGFGVHEPSVGSFPASVRRVIVNVLTGSRSGSSKKAETFLHQLVTQLNETFRPTKTKVLRFWAQHSKHHSLWTRILERTDLQETQGVLCVLWSTPKEAEEVGISWDREFYERFNLQEDRT
jgi:hypothetical protein